MKDRTVSERSLVALPRVWSTIGVADLVSLSCNASSSVFLLAEKSLKCRRFENGRKFEGGLGWIGCMGVRLAINGLVEID